MTRMPAAMPSPQKGHDTRAIQGGGAPFHHEHGGVYRAGAEPVPGFLARVIGIGRASVYRPWVRSS